jgi:hypothetical protein
MIKDDFDARTFANMNAALDRVCRKIAAGETHATRKFVAEHIIDAAKGGKTTLTELTAAAQDATPAMATGIGSAQPRSRKHSLFRLFN